MDRIFPSSPSYRPKRRPGGSASRSPEPSTWARCCPSSQNLHPGLATSAYWVTSEPGVLTARHWYRPAPQRTCPPSPRPTSLRTSSSHASFISLRLEATHRDAAAFPAILNQATTREDAFEFSGGSSDGGGPIKFLARLTFPALSGKMRSTNSISRLITPSRPSLASDCLM